MIKKLALMRNASRIQRLHTVPLTTINTVGEHTFNVLALIDCLSPGCSRNLLLAALYHDVPEYKTGDVPANAKWASPDLNASLIAIEDRIKREYDLEISLDAKEKQVLKFCDAMELTLFCIEEAERGNLHGIIIAKRCIDSLVQNVFGESSHQLLSHVLSYINKFPNKGVLFNEESQ